MNFLTVFWIGLGFAFALGAVVGSFLNVVIYRVPAGLSVVTPGSHCPHCHHAIRWYDNVPILAWLIWLRRRCRDCATPIPARYALVEALTGLLSAGVWFKVAWPVFSEARYLDDLVPSAVLLPFGFYFVFVCILVAITFVDLDHYLIPHEFTVPAMVLGVVAAFALNSEALIPAGAIAHLWPPVTPWMSVIGLLAGGAVVVALFVVYFAVRGTEGIGGGDVTLMAVMGAWLGWPALIFIFFAASVQGLIAAGLGALFGASFLKHSSEILGEDGTLEAPEQDEADPEVNDAAVGEAPDAQASSEGEGEEDETAPGGLAVPFGPFICLAGLEFFFFGDLLPMAFSMSYLYGIW
jgi:leader peptidase (prepilin peptidase) / N-methyltransferase